MTNSQSMQIFDTLIAAIDVAKAKQSRFEANGPNGKADVASSTLEIMNALTAAYVQTMRDLNEDCIDMTGLGNADKTDAKDFCEALDDLVVESFTAKLETDVEDYRRGDGWSDPSNIAAE